MIRAAKGLVGAIAALLAACSNPDRLTAERKADLVAQQQAQVDRMREAEGLIRSLNDPSTKAGRKRIRETAEERRSAEHMLGVIENLQVRE